jgi:hypothetical protein
LSVVVDGVREDDEGPMIVSSVVVVGRDLLMEDEGGSIIVLSVVVVGRDLPMADDGSSTPSVIKEQSFPKYPDSQLHKVDPSGPMEHVPPFTQGF